MIICYSSKRKSIQMSVLFTLTVIKSEGYDNPYINSESIKLAGKVIFLQILHIVLHLGFFHFSILPLLYSSPQRTQHRSYLHYGIFKTIGCHKVFGFLLRMNSVSATYRERIQFVKKLNKIENCLLKIFFCPFL
jgi:hypothetical protein